MGVKACRKKVVTKIYAVFRPGACKEGVAYILPNRVWGQNVY